MAAPKKNHAREPHQLPAGRHGLSGAFVVAHQQRRILTAVAELCEQAGYVQMSVQDIVVAAGVSRKTFYINYRDKEDAFLASYEDASQRVLGRITQAYASADTVVDRVRAGLHALLAMVAREPAIASMCLVEVLAAGPAALERRDAMMRELATLIDRATAGLPAARRPSPLVAETLVGGVYEVLATRVITKRLPEVPGLLPELLFALMLPYVGTEAAHQLLAHERRRANAGRVTA